MKPRLRKWRFPDWQPEYEAAIAAKSSGLRLQHYEDAIFKRCQKIAGKFGFETERDAIQLAIENLREIQKTKLGYPPWEQYFKSRHHSAPVSPSFPLPPKR
jgi:hypothetical protein